MSIVGAVLGKYRILAELSRGGMGEVYRAQHEILGKAAAIKLLRPELSENTALLTRFVNEAKAASAIRHPGIIQIYDFGTTDDGRAYLAMEFLEGESLADRLKRRGRLPADEAARIARGISGALTAAHDKGIIHRDLKPDNVFIVADPDMPSGERPKILDFGIAKLADGESRQTQTGMLMGTPLYMAPEQARAAAAIDHRADLYSLGCILYELVVGDPPFMGTGAGEIIALQMFQTPVPPRQHVPSLPADMERIVLRLLEKEPENRYQSAAELSAELAQSFAGVGSPMTTPMPFARRSLPVAPSMLPVPTADVEPPRRSLLPVVAGVLTLALAGAGVYFVTRSSSEPTPSSQPQPLPAPPVVEHTSPPAPAPVPAPAPPVPTPAPTPTNKKRPPRVNAVTPAGSADNRHTKTGAPIELTP